MSFRLVTFCLNVILKNIILLNTIVPKCQSDEHNTFECHLAGCHYAKRRGALNYAAKRFYKIGPVVQQVRLLPLDVGLRRRPRKHLEVSLLGNVGAKPFRQLDISSTRHFVN
jgi:hypothetical protein